MKLTLLQATQDVLSTLNFDPVSSIDETVEAQQVAQELYVSYLTLMAERDWPHLCDKLSFEGLGSLATPTKMRMPDSINKVKWVRYNSKEVVYMPPEEFNDLVEGRKGRENANADGYLTNQDPEYWTTYNDKDVWFDGYNSSVDNTLQESKSVVYVVKTPQWSMLDTFVPDMPQKMFATWLADAKSSCYINMKQTANTKEERRAQKGRMVMQNESWRNEKGEARFNRKVNYGR